VRRRGYVVAPDRTGHLPRRVREVPSRSGDGGPPIAPHHPLR